MVIPNGIDTERFSQIERVAPVHRGPTRLVTLAHLAPWKGHALLVEAARLVVASGQPARFRLCGDDRFGDQRHLQDRLRRRIDSRVPSGVVELCGNVPDARTVLARSDILVHPAFPEPLGRAVVEGMATGLPVIAFGGDHGPAEIVRSGKDGVLVSPRTAEALAAAIVDLAQRPALRDRMGEAGQRRAQRLFDRRVMARRVEALYEQLAAEPYFGR